MNVNAPTFVPSTTTPASDGQKAPSGSTATAPLPTAHHPPAPRDRTQKRRNQRSNHHHGNSKPGRAMHDRSSSHPAAQASYVREPRPHRSARAHPHQDTSAVEQQHTPELAAAVDKKGRVSLNHLLNFTLPERQRPPATHGPPRRRQVQHAPYNKERFLNANFRFIVNAGGEYNVHLADPDCAFEWDMVEQVLLSSASEEQACPICLSPPSAARVTKCGHVFCLPCVLHYLALRENPKKQWRKCPICWDAIYERDMKPVKLLVSPWASHRTGDHLDMALLYRAAGSTLAFPVSDTWPLPDAVVDSYLGRGQPLTPWQFTPHAMHFSRFMLASPAYLKDEFARDRTELQDAIRDAEQWGSTNEIPFIMRAIEHVNTAIERTARQHTKRIDLAMHTCNAMFEAATSSKSSVSWPTVEATTTEGESSFDGQPQPREEASDEVPMAYLVQQQQHAGNSHTALPKKQQQQQQQQPQKQQPCNTAPAAEYYFFQAADGQHVYLHPLDSRVMKHEYGDYSHFPLRLQVRVEGVEESSMTEDLRKRFKYLSHLPLACDITFVEVDLKKLVSEATLKTFDNELKQRAKKRQERIRREERMRKAAETRQKKQTRRHEEENRRIMDSDPFFQINQPMRPEEDDEMLANAIAMSSLEQAGTSGPRTVWGTRAVPTHEEERAAQSNEWADHIIVTTKKKKNKHKKK